MEKDKFIEKVKEIGLLESDVDIRSELTKLTDDLSPMFDRYQALEEENNKYKEDNEKLREANMQLFLRVGSKTVEEAQEDITGKEEIKEPRKYADLFDENGNLK